MATVLMKWWRARFLTGYKSFSVGGGIAEGSDSEELLPSATTPCNTSSPVPVSCSPLLIPEASTPPTPVPTPPATVTPTIPASKDAADLKEQVNNKDQTDGLSNPPQLNFEEFECDVSVAEGNRRRQEFSFTLYDFDGHGNITKDDIAGLVTTIYDKLGASIKVPPCGSKTIKVKLTVSPDKSINNQEIIPPAVVKHHSTNLPNVVNPSCCHIKPINSCSHATHARRLPRKRRLLRNRIEKIKIESHSEEDADNIPGINQSKQEELRRRVGPVPHLPSPYSNSSEGDVSDDSDVSPSPLTPLVINQKRSGCGSMQRQQLLEIIQANMEKNNLSFHSSRKRHQSEHLRVPLQRPYVEATTSPYCAQRSRPPSASRQPPPTNNYHKPVREYSHHLDSTSLPKGRDNNLRKARNHHHHHRHHHHSNVLSTPNVDTTTTTTTTTTNNNKLRNNLQSTPPPPQLPNIINPNILNSKTTTTPQNNINNINNVNHIKSKSHSKKHQLKHVTREKDQARAMEQVVRWLEREFSQSAAETATGKRHVHEHIHHHYHHYQGEALI